jgi:DNA repair protein RadD
LRLTLRPYQTAALDGVRAAFAQGRRAPLLCAPTGAGKTVMFAHITEGAAAKGKRVLILVHRRELLLQCSRALDELGVRHGLISPAYKQTTDAVQVASVQTLTRRLHRIAPPDLIVVDEAHHATAGSWSRVLAAFPRAKLLGVTATPTRMDGHGLSDVFDALILGPSVRSLIDAGFLSRPVVYAPAIALPDKMKHRAGDFDPAAAAALLDKGSVYGDVLKHYRRLCDGKPALVFCVNIAHAHHMAEQFNAAGFKAAALDGDTEDAPRRKMVADLGNGGLNVLTSCDVVSEGTDIPAVYAALLLRPTESVGLYLQQVGRVLRPYPGKDRAVILDFVGNVLRHDMPDAAREWTLDGAGQGKAATDDGAPVQRMKLCGHCYALCPAWQTKCEQCGNVFEARRAPPKQVEGELVEITDEAKAAMRVMARREEWRANTLEDFQKLAQDRGYAPAWARIRWNLRQRRHA